MRLARKLVLLAVMALAALAMSATSASAEEPVEVTQEANTEHCDFAGVPQVLCETTATGEEGTVIRAHLDSGPEVVTSICQDIFHAVVETEGGEGYIDQQVLSGGSCPNKPCGATTQVSGDGDPWDFDMHETEGENPTHEFGMDVLFCLEPADGGAASYCHIEVGFNETEMNHQYEFEAEGEGDGVPCTGMESTAPPTGVRVLEVDGHWITDDENIEVNHAPEA